MAEGQQPGEAKQQVEGHREQGEAQDLHQKDRVQHKGRHQQDGDEDGVDGQFLAVLRLLLSQDGVVNVCRVDGLGHAHASLPNRPVGRTIRTTTMTRKMTADDAGG